MKDLDIILEEVSCVTGVYPKDICGSCRKREYVNARQIFSLVARDKKHSYSDIGEAINRDHTSILHLCKKRPISNDVKRLANHLNYKTDEVLVKVLAHRLSKDPTNEEVQQQLKKAI